MSSSLSLHRVSHARLAWKPLNQSRRSYPSFSHPYIHRFSLWDTLGVSFISPCPVHITRADPSNNKVLPYHVNFLWSLIYTNNTRTFKKIFLKLRLSKSETLPLPPHTHHSNNYFASKDDPWLHTKIMSHRINKHKCIHLTGMTPSYSRRKCIFLFLIVSPNLNFYTWQNFRSIFHKSPSTQHKRDVIHHD